MDFGEAFQTYIDESRELLDEMESSLLALERGNGDESGEHLNSIFRAAHTIKGSAGLFGLDVVVRFTHDLETMLDDLRDGKFGLTLEIVNLLFKCCDHLRALIDAVADGEAARTDALTVISDDLLSQLKAVTPSSVVTAAEEGAGRKEQHSSANADPLDEYISSHFSSNTVHESQDLASGRQREIRRWHISLRFARDTFRDGMDPASFLVYLKSLGELISIIPMVDQVPVLENVDPESCYLGFEMSFEKDCSIDDIRGVFEFVQDESFVRVISPGSPLTEFSRLQEELEEPFEKLCCHWIECGSLTQSEADYLLGAGREAVAELPPEINVESTSTAEEPTAQVADTNKPPPESKSIRVDANRLDELINLIGELVTSGAGSSLLAKQTGDSAIQDSMNSLTELIEEVRDAALKLRMVQIGNTFNRFRRVVRDLVQELDKDIKLAIYGADTELDKTVVEKIADPLMHLIRNSIDHGIESPEERESVGKPRSGTLTLNAYHDSGSIVLEVRDDGRGLSAEKIRKKSVEKNLIGEDNTLTDEELYQLIFEPGFSTAEAVTDLSGRGVGMDVVKRNVTDIGGRVSISSLPGQGTSIQITLPLTLAIIDGFLVRVGNAHFVMPLESVLECVELTASNHEVADNSNYMNLRGEVLPFLRLREIFQIQEASSGRENVVVIRFGNKKAGLVVDQLQGEFQTVIKPLGPIFMHLEGLSGSTIMGNGEVALILDIANLIKRFSNKDTPECA